ncbi:MAG TPA: maleylpyruvate isomerase N-terminal domain-containing protein, partial [Streptomyces sp.]|uniref:maleylpyruvate isomerase N-terminal domain-containing protein n=1 Tax=Streptomyces sp. TaxID=1931 RepID=UPI002D2FDEF1
FRACLGGDLSVPVEHCGDWTLRDLAEHLGRGNLWAATAVTEGHGHGGYAAVPEEPEAVRWFQVTSATLLDALDTDPSAPAWTFHPPEHGGLLAAVPLSGDGGAPLGRRAHLGTVRPIDAELAGDGVAEVFEVPAPRMVARGRTAPPGHALRLTATDTGASWTYGPGVPVAAVSATAENLLLMLWRRLPADGEALAWEGDRAAGQRVLDGPLVP